MLWKSLNCPFPQRSRWAGTLRVTQNPGPRPQTTLALGTWGPGMASRGRNISHLPQEAQVCAGESMGALWLLHEPWFSELRGWGVRPPCLQPQFPHVNYTSISQGPSGSNGLRSQDSKWPRESWGDEPCSLLYPWVTRGPGMQEGSVGKAELNSK